MTYAEKLKDPRWQRKRLEIFNRDKWKCVNCGSGSDTLHVHHSRYQAGREPWEHDEQLLLTLCDKCHALETNHRKEVDGHLVSGLVDAGWTIDQVYYLHWSVVDGKTKKPSRKQVLALFKRLESERRSEKAR